MPRPSLPFYNQQRHIYVWGIVERDGSDGPVKVGYSLDPGKRVEFFAGIIPYELRLYYSRRMKGDLANAVERHTHHLLSEFSMRREWFDVPSDVAVAAVREAERFVFGLSVKWTGKQVQQCMRSLGWSTSRHAETATGVPAYKWDSWTQKDGFVTSSLSDFARVVPVLNGKGVNA